MRDITGLNVSIYECPKCKAWDDKVIDSRYNSESTVRLRTRRCSKCGKKWDTIELTREEFESLLSSSDKNKINSLLESIQILRKKLLYITSLASSLEEKLVK